MIRSQRSHRSPAACAAVALLGYGWGLGSGCGYSGDGPVLYDPNLVAALLVEAHLAPEATRAMSFAPLHTAHPDDNFLLEHVVITHGASAGGVRLVHLLFATSRSPTAPNKTVEGWLELDASGRARPLVRPAEAPALRFDPRRPEERVWRGGADGAETGYVLECRTDAATVFDLAGGELRARPAPRELCNFAAGGRLGRSAAPDHLVLAQPDGANLRVESFDLGGGPIRASALPRPTTRSVPLWVEEEAPGRFVALTVDAVEGRLARLATGEAPRLADGPASSSVAARRGPGDRARLFAADGSGWFWDAAEASEPTSWPAPVAPPELEVSPWKLAGTPGAGYRLATGINRYSELVQVPLAAFASVPSPDGVFAASAATTPCVVREACREYGESYLIGVFETGAEPMGLYAFWSWTYELGVYAAPLFRDESGLGGAP